MDTGVQEGGGEPTGDDAVRRSIYNILQRLGRALGKAKSQAPLTAGDGDLTGSVRSHVSVSYDDGPLDIFECIFTIRALFLNDSI